MKAHITKHTCRARRQNYQR